MVGLRWVFISDPLRDLLGNIFESDITANKLNNITYIAFN